MQAVAAGNAGTLLTDKRVNGNHLRVLVRQAPEPGVALLVARPLDEVDGVLRRLLRILAAVVAGGAGLGHRARRRGRALRARPGAPLHRAHRGR